MQTLQCPAVANDSAQAGFAAVTKDGSEMGLVGSGMSGGPYGGLSGGGGIGGGGFGAMSGGPVAGATVTQYATGPRGTEKITSRDAQTGNTIKILYAMYDAHGNMMSTARRSGSQLLIENHRGYDAWGSIRWGDGSTGGSGHGVGGGGDPFDASATDGSQRYVGNLGHMADDESCLIYMRARYYEPSTGRFISEDPAMDGKNWLVYCRNVPTMGSDFGGTISNWAEAIRAFINTMSFTTGIALGYIFTALLMQNRIEGYKAPMLANLAPLFGIAIAGTVTTSIVNGWSRMIDVKDGISVRRVADKIIDSVKNSKTLTFRRQLPTNCIILIVGVMVGVLRPLVESWIMIAHLPDVVSGN